MRGLLESFEVVRLSAEIMAAFGATEGQKTPLPIDFKEALVISNIQANRLSWFFISSTSAR